MKLYTRKFFIEYGDTDIDCKITNKGFLRYMQETAMLHSDLSGYSAKTTVFTNKAWVLLNWKIQVFKRAMWNEEITINTWERKIDKYFAYRDFEILDSNNTLIAKATSKWVLVDSTTHNITLIDPQATTVSNIIDKSVFGDFKFSKLKPQTNFDNSLKYTILKRDLDSNSHVNNLNYIDFAYEVLPSSIDFTELEISYLKESKLEDILEIGSTFCDNTYTVTIKNTTQNCISAIIYCK